jgi:endonuclease I
MKKLLGLFLTCLSFTGIAQPAGYYDPAAGLTGQALRAALATIIRPHTELNYTPGVWAAYNTTDRKPNGKVWDIYSDIPGGTPPYEYTYSADQCGSSSSSAENSCYNREHTWPQSKFSFPGADGAPAGTDVFHIYPSDYWVNNQRGNYPYGKVTSPSQTFMNGSKLGSNTYPGSPSGTSFEPIDSFKGDIARTYFYMSTCYRNDSGNFVTWEMATLVALKPWAAAMLLEWHHLDPVSKKEIDRNNAIYALQNNRNPFIDHPEYADCIWGTANCSTTFVPNAISATQDAHIYPVPAVEVVHVSWQYASAAPIAVSVTDVAGRVVYHAPVNAAGSELALDVSAWPNGIYAVQLQYANTVKVYKLVVE